MDKNYLRNRGEFSFDNIGDYQIIKEDLTIKYSDFYDTFDKLVEQKGYYLEYCNNFFYIKIRKSDEVIENCEIKQKDIFKIDDFEDSGFKNLLKSLIGSRAIIKKFTYKISEQKIILIREKYKNKLELIQYKAYLPLREYVSVDFLKRIDGNLGSFDYIFSSKNYNSFSDFYLALEMASPDYEGKMFDLKRDISGALPNHDYFEMLHYYLRRFIDAFWIYYHGIVEDIDIEFIHDFRVANRKMLVLLKDNNHNFDFEVDYFIKKFTKLQKKTNLIRDIDILIEKKEFLSEILPKENFKNFYSYLKKQREKEFSKLKKYLQSSEYTSLLKDFKNYVNSYVNVKSIGSVEKIQKPIIKKKVESLLSIDRKYLSSLDDYKLHKLRIKIKKIRYSLEFYQNFWDNYVFEENIAKVKDFQTYLGEITDLNVTENMLRKFYAKNIKESLNDYNFVFYGIDEQKSVIKKDIVDRYRLFVASVVKILI